LQNQNIKNQNIRLRFAPSPTGYLHIGSARTAFFNWLYAKKTGGKFILRIEDTDIKRHKEDTINTIIDSLKWLGLNWDEGPFAGGNYGPYRQSERQDIYIKYAYKLLNEGKAYYCFCSAEELQKKREEALKNGVFFKYDKKCLNLSDAQIQRKISANEKFSIRIIVPENKIISFNDNVYGHIEVNSNTIEDYIILRSNKTPTYNFSVAIDDFLMKITHVIRGEDHLSNTPKQLLIYDGLGFDYPDFTHLPMILSADGQKLSKRHGSISIESYREEGFLPEAVLNYIALLGWAYDEKSTFFTVDEMIEKFDLKSVNKKASRFDYEKLLFINSYYIRNKDNKELEKLLTERLLKNNLQYFKDHINKNPDNNLDNQDIDEKIIAEMLEQKIAKIVPIIKERAKTLNEMQNKIMPFFFNIKYSDKLKNYFKNKDIDAKSILVSCIDKLNKISENDFNTDKIEPALRNMTDELNLNFRKIAEVIRIAIWGEPVSPPLFETIEILGKITVISRLKNYLELIEL
jgi:glutamyl-tRNA synthetase